MAQTGTAATRLVVLRGNSGSGKSTVATLLRDRIGRGVAWVEQDYIRRILLREHDRPDATNIGLLGHTVRYALDAGYHVILEGILNSGRYAAMLTELTADHRGTVTTTSTCPLRKPSGDTRFEHNETPSRLTTCASGLTHSTCCHHLISG